MYALKLSFVICFVGIILSACSPVNVKNSSKSENIYYTSHIIKKVPFYPQETFQCGPASMAEVLNYWGG